MSYGILYRSLFVKTRDCRYIAMVEEGSNNCYEYVGGPRARGWSDFYATAQKPLTATELMAIVEDKINSTKRQYVGKLVPDYDGGDGVKCYTDFGVERRYSYFSALTISGKTRTTAQQIRNFFKRGIERAIDFGTIPLKVCWITDFPNHEYRYPNTEEEFFAAIREAESMRCMPWATFTCKEDAEIILLRQKFERLSERARKGKGGTKVA